MFDINWLLDQQDVLDQHPHSSERVEYEIPDYSGFSPDPETDPYYAIRQAIWPQLHEKIYGNIFEAV